MARLTIAITDDRHRALKEAAARLGRTIGDLVEEALDFYGIKPARAAADLVAEARRRAALSEAEAVRVARRERGTGRRR